jgi:hypothetical protein
MHSLMHGLGSVAPLVDGHLNFLSSMETLCSWHKCFTKKISQMKCIVNLNLTNPSMCIFDLLSQPYFGQVWGWSPTLGKSEDLESFGTPECSELDSKAQNTSHWGVLGVIGKVLKRRYRKCPRIVDLDICSPSYGQKIWLPTTKSRESTRSRWPIRECDTPLERYRRGLQLRFIPRRDPRSGRGVMPSQSPGSPEPGHVGGFRDSNLGVPGICVIWMWVRRSIAEYTIGSMVVAYSRARGVVCPSESECPWLVPTPKGPWMDSNQLVLVCDAGSCNLKAWSLPSLIPGLPTRPSTPF